MNLRSVDLNLLTVFDAIMVEQNLSRAAEKIGMSQPAISNALARLRITMKDELFINTGRGVRPTPKALELAEPIRGALEKIANTLSQTQGFDPTSSSRKFVLSSADYGVAVIFPTLINRLNEMGATVLIDIQQHSSDFLKEKMNFGTVDIALDYDPVPGSDLEHRAVLPEGACCLVRKNHPFITDSMTLKHYCKAKHIATNQTSLFDKHLMKHNIQRDIAMRVPNYFNIPHIVPNTDLVSTLPQRLAEKFAKQFDLKIFPAPIPDWNVSIFLLWHKNQNHDPGHKWLRDIVIDACKHL
jgi:DNA-binding transcriptional LysR family regulator